MTRVFGPLAVSVMLLMMLTAGAGLLGENYLSGENWQSRHVLLAVITAIFYCFVQIVVFTYLTVTGKLIAQAVHLGKLPMDTIQLAKSLKKRVTRLLAGAIATIVVTVASGASKWSTGSNSSWHLAATGLLIISSALILYNQYPLIVTNQQLVDDTLAEYRKTKVPGYPPS